MQFSTDERHGQSLELLTELRAFLQRWPAHPSMARMIARLDAHLQDPVHQLIQQAERERVGFDFTPGGAYLLQASLKGDGLKVWIPSGVEVADDDVVLARLHKGAVMTLKPRI